MHAPEPLEYCNCREYLHPHLPGTDELILAFQISPNETPFTVTKDQIGAHTATMTLTSAIGFRILALTNLAMTVWIHTESSSEVVETVGGNMARTKDAMDGCMCISLNPLEFA